MTKRCLLLILLCASIRTALAQPNAPAADSNQDAGGVATSQEDRHALYERRKRLIEHCEREHGVDCEREVDTELRAEALPSASWLIRLRPERDR